MLCAVHAVAPSALQANTITCATGLAARQLLQAQVAAHSLRPRWLGAANAPPPATSAGLRRQVLLNAATLGEHTAFVVVARPGLFDIYYQTCLSDKADPAARRRTRSSWPLFARCAPCLHNWLEQCWLSLSDCTIGTCRMATASAPAANCFRAALGGKEHTSRAPVYWQ